MTIACSNCPLRKLPLFKQVNSEEITFLERFKTGEFKAQPGTEILAQDASSSQLFTALSGMGLRHRTLANGRRQVVGFVLPGDFIGLQSGVMDVMGHSVEATTEMTLCAFNRSDLWTLFRNHPERAFDLTHLAAMEESLLGEALSAVGQLDALGKIGWALLRFHRRLTDLELDSDGRVPLPYRQQDLADALGLSLVHTNKTLARLKEMKIATWADDGLIVQDADALAELTQVNISETPLRPLI